MKILSKVLVAASLWAVSCLSYSETSLTTGYMSDYYFRGIQLGESSAYASVDYSESGFYAGIWIADDSATSSGNDGLETDFFVGYSGSVGDFAYGIGYTRYEYTYDTGFQEDVFGNGAANVNTTGQFEQEINLSGAVAGLGLDIAIGAAEADHVTAAADPASLTMFVPTLGSGISVSTEQDYTYAALSYGHGPWGLLLGFWDGDDIDASGGLGSIEDTDGEYKHLEVTYSADVGGFAMTALLGQQFDVEEGGERVSSKGNNYLVFDISKSFDL